MNSGVLALESVFDGNTKIPLTNIKPNLTNWHVDTSIIFEKHAAVIDRVSQHLTEKYQISNTLKISTQLVSTAIIWHHKNTSTANKVTSNLNDVKDLLK